MPVKAKKTAMTAAHKQALAEGREQSRVVRDYLDALEAHKPKRGRKRTADTVKKNLAEVNQSLKSSVGSNRLEQIQRRRDLEVELAGMQAGGVDITALEKAFTKVGKSYAVRKSISYAAFREFGVPSEVLKRAGISRATTA
jgi:hypothetical protein